MKTGFREHVPHIKYASFPTADSMKVELDDGRSVTMPVSAFPFLKRMEDCEREAWTLFDGGLRWNASGDDIRVEDILGDSRKYAPFKEDDYFFRGMSEETGEKVEGVHVVISNGYPFIATGNGHLVPVSPGTLRKMLRTDDANPEEDGGSPVSEAQLKELRQRLTETVLGYISENGLGDIRSVTFTTDIFQDPDNRDGFQVKSTLVARGIFDETAEKTSDGKLLRTYRVRRLGQVH